MKRHFNYRLDRIEDRLNEVENTLTRAHEILYKYVVYQNGLLNNIQASIAGLISIAALALLLWVLCWVYRWCMQ
jgi:hypothetical protein